jgi:hypothetical protein
MAKFYGPIGYGVTTETSPGVWTPSIEERMYAGDILQNNRRVNQGESTNDNLDVSNQLSILADPYALNHFHTIKYVKWLGAAWKITTVDVQYPRLILTIGGVYNGETAESA